MDGSRSGDLEEWRQIMDAQLYLLLTSSHESFPPLKLSHLIVKPKPVVTPRNRHSAKSPLSSPPIKIIATDLDVVHPVDGDTTEVEDDVVAAVTRLHIIF